MLIANDLFNLIQLISHDCSSCYIATANMQGGCRVYLMNHGLDKVLDEVSYHDESDNHLSYGIDIIDESCTEGLHKIGIVSCSFYDNLISSWSATFNR